jgi:peptidyl-prolyl cis-trans isomerase D
LKRTKDDAKALAGKVLGEVKANPNNFAKLAETYTDEPVGKSRGGDLGFFRKNQMAPEFANAAFALKPGEISDVVETPFGFHIIRVDAVQEAKSVSLDQARNEIAQKLLARDRKPEILAEKVKALLAAVKAGGGDAEMKDLNVSWKETGDFALGASVIPGGLGSDKSLRQAIAQLKKPGDFAADPLVVNGSSYVLRLKTRTDADLSKLDEKQRETMSESSRFMEAFGLYSALTSDIRKRYEDGKKIYKNSDFLNYDAKLRGPGAS